MTFCCEICSSEGRYLDRLIHIKIYSHTAKAKVKFSRTSIDFQPTANEATTLLPLESNTADDRCHSTEMWQAPPDLSPCPHIINTAHQCTESHPWLHALKDGGTCRWRRRGGPYMEMESLPFGSQEWLAYACLLAVTSQRAMGGIVRSFWRIFL
jgi:hypothetical protein